MDKVTYFHWDEFPVEKDKFSICLIKGESPPDTDFLNLTNYIKIVFPESSTLLIDYDTSIDAKWTLELSSRSHKISVGKYSNIPKSVLTNSDILIFSSIDDFNTYFRSKHFKTTEGFDIVSKFIVIDKRKINPSIHAISKSDLIRYHITD